MRVKYLLKEALEEYCEKEERSFSWVAEKLGMSRQNFYSFLRKDKYTVDELLKVAEFINVKIEKIYKIEK